MVRGRARKQKIGDDLMIADVRPQPERCLGARSVRRALCPALFILTRLKDVLTVQPASRSRATAR